MKKHLPRKLTLARTTVRILQSNAASLVVGGMPTSLTYSNPLETCTSEAMSNCGACPYPTNPLSNRNECW